MTAAGDVVGATDWEERTTPLILDSGENTSSDIEVIQRINKLPAWIHDMYNHVALWVGQWSDGNNSEDPETWQHEDGRRRVKHPAQAHVMSSSTSDEGWEHVLALDIDKPAVLFPSSSEGHHHLIISGEYDWEDIKDLMLLLQKMGILGQGFVEQSIRRKATFLRLPWIKKGSEPHYQQVAMNAFLDGQIVHWETQRQNAGRSRPDYELMKAKRVIEEAGGFVSMPGNNPMAAVGNSAGTHSGPVF